MLRAGRGVGRLFTPGATSPEWSAPPSRKRERGDDRCRVLLVLRRRSLARAPPFGEEQRRPLTRVSPAFATTRYAARSDRLCRVSSGAGARPPSGDTLASTQKRADPTAPVRAVGHDVWRARPGRRTPQSASTRSGARCTAAAMTAVSTCPDHTAAVSVRRIGGSGSLDTAGGGEHTRGRRGRSWRRCPVSPLTFQSTTRRPTSVLDTVGAVPLSAVVR
jgi:hypothetical protein